MAVLNKRAVVSAIEMYGVSAIRLPMVLGESFNQLIKSLFANSEQGFAYDPNDLSTMFQDAAGTIPVTGAGQPVGLMLDKSKGLELSAEKLTNGDFSNGSTGWNYTAGVWDFTNGFARKNPNIAGTDLTQGSAIVGKWYKVTYTISRHASGNHYARCGTAIGTVNQGIGTFTSYVLATSKAGIGFGASVVADLDLVNISIKEIEGSHAQQTTSASRPILRQNAATGAYYLEFDGSDDFLQTANINFTATDKISLFTGVVKFVNRASILCELSTNANTEVGSFYISAPEGSPGAYGFKAKGGLNVSSTITSVTSANDVSVLSAFGNISGDNNTLRRNAVSSTTAADLGLGNFGNYPLYIGRRGGTSIPFTGHIYSLIGIGRLTSDDETAAIEKELAKRTGVTLSV